MFKFLKDKLKKTIAKLSGKIEEEGKDVETEEAKEEPPKEEKREAKEEPTIEKIEIKEEISEPVKEKLLEKEEIQYVKIQDPKHKEEKKDFIHEPEKIEKIVGEKKPEEKKVTVKEELPEKVGKEEESKKEPEKKGFFKRVAEKVTAKKINEAQFENFFNDLELALLENNVAVEVIDKIKADLKMDLVNVPIKRRKIDEKIRNALKSSIEDLFNTEKINLLNKIKEKRPYIICFFGINGSGKTTTIAKLTQFLKDNKLSVVLAASDTFRAASIEQLQTHADSLNVKLIKHDYGSDPAAVAFDAIEHAKSKNIDVVLIDTAGRQHSNQNLMEELKKIIRVTNPDFKLFVGESITGNDCVEQARKFNETLGVDGIILTKADIDEKGGAAISVSFVTGKPVLYLGTGQKYSDLTEFDSEKIIASIGL